MKGGKGVDRNSVYIYLGDFLNTKLLQDPFGVAVGGTLGHCLCTGLAVVGGRMVAQKISVRTGKICLTEQFIPCSAH